MATLFVGLLFFSAVMVCFFSGAYIADKRYWQPVGYIFGDFAMSILEVMAAVNTVLSLLKGHPADAAWCAALLGIAVLWFVQVFMGLYRLCMTLEFVLGLVQVALLSLRVVWHRLMRRWERYAYRQSKRKVVGAISGGLEAQYVSADTWRSNAKGACAVNQCARRGNGNLGSEKPGAST